MDVPKEVQEATIVWYKFLARPENIAQAMLITGGYNPKVELSEADKAKNGPVYAEYSNAVKQYKNAIACYQTRWDGKTMYDVFATELPNFVTNRLTADQLLEKMSKSATKYVEELNKNK